MNDAERRAAAKEFAAYWKDRGYEKGESQKFWLSLLRDVCGLAEPEKAIIFEDQVHLDHTSFIDGIIPETHVMIEQKGMAKDLLKPIKQSDGTLLTPFQQAKRYSAELPYSQRPRWIVTCNFQEFHVYDMEKPGGDPEKILLKDLPTDYYRLSFLTDAANPHLEKEMEISIQAGELVGILYDALRDQYKDPDDPETLKHLNMLCVRLVFCLYAEDAGIFGRRDMFHDYMEAHRANARDALIELFRMLDTPDGTHDTENKRDPYKDEDLLAFPYVDGGLFEDENVIIPRLSEEILDILLQKASAEFDWSAISPTIFGAVFESTLNPETRRAGGMHYTSIENIHKVIDPLFLDDLKAELDAIKEISAEKTRIRKLQEFQEKLGRLKFLDPACGSGNFLTETYISLRRLENEALRLRERGQMSFGMDVYTPIRVSIGQFYGIEINDFAVTVAKTALWIAESQMLKETEDIVHQSIDFLPLKSYANITEGNALRMKWEDIVPRQELFRVMGNPPFVGYSLQSKEQKEDILSVYRDENGNPYKTAGKIDYVSGWYFKASELMQGTDIRTAFVSTNSITQGEQVAGVWEPLYQRFGIHIDFAHRTFIWDSEASIKAHVHCVIVGFSAAENKNRRMLFSSERMQYVENINPYLVNAADVFIKSRTTPICDVPLMVYGNKPTDGGFLFLTEDEMNEAIRNEPEIEKYIKRIYGATEYINNIYRYCLWLVDAKPEDMRKSKFISDRVRQVKEFRLSSTKEATRKSAENATLFQEIRQPDTEYILIPRHSSENRRYIPFGFVSPEIIVNDAVQIIPDASVYHFGILESNVHMAWTRAICGRIKSDYRYSKDVVYNNFPWPDPSPEQKMKIEETAQGILTARSLYKNSSMADLYDDNYMPPELRKAHQQNDKAVLQAYGFPTSASAFSEADCVAALMELYEKIRRS